MGEVDVLDAGSLADLRISLGLSGSRTHVLMLGSRAERAQLRSHGRYVQTEHAVISAFHRPRAEREEMEAMGIDHRGSCWQFIDVALSDLGRWMQPLMDAGWARTNVKVTPADVAPVPFETVDWMCFHAPGISAPSTLPLVEAPERMLRKIFLTHPGGVIEARAETEAPSPPVKPTPAPEPEVVVEEAPAPAPAPAPVVSEESPLEEELRQTISLLKAGGLDMTEIMDHEQFSEVSERASAAGIDVWNLLLKHMGSA